MVSVIITTFGGGEKLNRAITSVLKQTYRELEIIVVDDNDPQSANRKKTEKVMEKFNTIKEVKYVKHTENKNGAAARNTGITIALGDYIAFLDDDDIYLPERLEKSVHFMEENSECAGICTGVVLMEKGHICALFQPNRTELSEKDILQDQMIIGTGSNIFLKGDIVKKVNGFDDKFQRFQDLEFMLRVVEIGKISFINDLLIVKEKNENRSLNYHKVKEAYLKFSDKFKREISDLSEKERKGYYLDRIRGLYYIAKYQGNRTDIEDVKKLMKENQIKIPIKEIIKKILKSLYYFFAGNTQRGHERILHVKDYKNRKKLGVDICNMLDKEFEELW